MKKHIILVAIFSISLLLFSCINRKENSPAKTNLKGKVKTVEVLNYKSSKKGNEKDTGSLYFHHTSKYNIEGERTEVNWISIKDSLAQKDYFKYDKKGNMIKQSRYFLGGKYNRNDSIHWVYSYKYDDKGNLTEKNTYKTDDSILTNKVTYKYDSRGIKTEEIWYDFYDSLKLQFTFKFDKNGNTIEQVRYDLGKPTKMTAKYDKNGIQIEANTFKADGSLRYKYTYEYDEYGNLTEDLEHSPDGSLSQKYTYKYKYDKTGNWIEKISFINDIQTEFAVRKIEYYP